MASNLLCVLDRRHVNYHILFKNNCSKCVHCAQCAACVAPLGCSCGAPGAGAAECCGVVALFRGCRMSSAKCKCVGGRGGLAASRSDGSWGSQGCFTPFSLCYAPLTVAKACSQAQPSRARGALTEHYSASDPLKHRQNCPLLFTPFFSGIKVLVHISRLAMLSPEIVSKRFPEHEGEDSDPGLWHSDAHIIVRA